MEPNTKTNTHNMRLQVASLDSKINWADAQAAAALSRADALRAARASLLEAIARHPATRLHSRP